jgi:chromatin segregation and condensation protein Rec8/ScpA/Scc1 (kleisin family)
MATPKVSKDKYNMENNLRQLINIIEGRNPDIQYQDKEGEVIAMLQSYDSQSYTKLAQKVKRIEQLKEEIKALEDEVKQSTRDDITDLFDAEDAVKTRVVQTMSFILTLSKDPVATKTPKYKDILAALSNHLTPELIKVLEGLKEQMVTVTQKSPSLKIRPLDEGFVNSLFARLKMAIMNWASRYDQKLAQLQQMAS